MSNKRSIGIALIGIAVLAVIAVTMHTPIEEKKTAVSSSDIKPAVIFDMGGKFDKSFNEGVWAGVKKFTEETGITAYKWDVGDHEASANLFRTVVASLRKSFGPDSFTIT